MRDTLTDTDTDTEPEAETGAETGAETLRAARTGVELLVCLTCRAANTGPGDDALRDGARLLAAIEGAGLPGGVGLRGVECLSNCTRGCTVALRGPGRWSYVYGDLDPSMAGIVLDGAARYAGTPDGLVPWRERPEHFRKHCIARLPPLED